VRSQPAVHASRRACSGTHAPRGGHGSACWRTPTRARCSPSLPVGLPCAFGLRSPRHLPAPGSPLPAPRYRHPTSATPCEFLAAGISSSSSSSTPAGTLSDGRRRPMRARSAAASPSRAGPRRHAHVRAQPQHDRDELVLRLAAPNLERLCVHDTTCAYQFLNRKDALQPCGKSPPRAWWWSARQRSRAH